MDFTLLADGTSDQVLLRHLHWIISMHAGANVPVQSHWADLSYVRVRPRTLAERIRLAVDLYRCDLLFVHRDAEAQDPEDRRVEIHRAVAEVAIEEPVIAVVPVRMTEAWLLFDENAVRKAAGNPAGRIVLDLRYDDPESIADPKKHLHAILKIASELKGRRLRKFDADAAVHRVADYIDDFSPLRCVPAFRSLETEIAALVQRKNWC